MTNFGQIQIVEAFDIFAQSLPHVSAVEGNIINCGIQVCEGTNKDDIIIGSPLNETILGRNGNDNIQGNGGDDIVYGGKGNDIISGGSGFDKLFGQDGNDIIIGDADLSLAPALVNNELAAVNFYDALLLGVETNLSASTIQSISANSSNNTADIFASQQASNPLLLRVQLLDGGKGDDYLIGQSGNELFIGGPGHDYFDCNEGIDTVLDFNPKEDTANTNCDILK